MRRAFFITSTFIVLLQFPLYFINPWLLLDMVIFGPLIIMGVNDVRQTKRTLLRNYPLFGRLRYVMEELRPKIYQYFVESDTDGTPINRVHRSVIYQRAKKDLSSTPFGTQFNVYEEGYEWINHSMSPLSEEQLPHELRVVVGGKACKKPYNASLLNVSAMSFGALSQNAVMALNKGAKLGGFAHNTGEGGISPYHLEHGGDLIWQIGTGYFGCRTLDGKFDPGLFREKSNIEQVKMIEIKLSQGAKPGHGGILPAKKNTPEIAKIRNVVPHTDVLSPPMHTAFQGPMGLLEFVQNLRELSGGRPVGLKLCFGIEKEFQDLCEAMVATGIRPDFITIDGGEGGTGAAPLEFSNSIGMPLRDGLVRAYDLLLAYDLKKDVKLICSGKIITGFHAIQGLALGADLCNSARAMMMALGCIQALICNTNKCPTGVATQDPQLYEGLVVEDKALRVKNFHNETVHAVKEIMAAAGLKELSQLKRSHIFRRIGPTEIKTLEQLYPYPAVGSFLSATQRVARAM